MPVEPGDLLDRYRIVTRLGAGGMGEVFHAFDTRLERNVALKLLHAETEAASTAGNLAVSNGVARMLREARAAAALEHPNVISIYDVGEVQEPASLRGTPFLAMELIKGSSLRVFGQDRSVPYAERLRWLIDIAKALGAAHAQGLVHRDVKPENVMIRQDGVVKVLDFGIAKRSYGSVDPAQSTESRLLPMPTLTTGNVAVGTPYYMAPEQMRGDALDGRADQFSWGVMAFEILCGKGPWRMDGDALSLVAEVLSKPAEMPTGHDVPPSVAKVILKALSKSRDDRFPSMTRLLQELQDGESVTSPVASQPRLSLDEAADLGSAKTEIFQSIREAKTVPSKFPPPTVEPPRRRKATRTMAIGAALVASISILGGLYAFRQRAKGAASDTASAGASIKVPDCTSNVDCIRSHDGNPFRCLREEGRCAPLVSEDCKLLGDPRLAERDDAVWIGTMLPLTGDGARAGTAGTQAVDLARQDFEQTLGKIPGVRPLGVIACNDVVDPMRAARHLRDAKVVGVIGFRASSEAIEVASSIFSPAGILTVAANNTAPQITSIPETGGARLVWRTTYNLAQTAAPLALLVSDVLEPRLRAMRGGLTRTNPMKAALVRYRASNASAFADVFFSGVSFNGKTALDNGSNYREIVIDPNAADMAAESRSAVEALVSFAPGVIVYAAELHALVKDVLEPVEAAWPTERAPRPFYATWSAVTPEVLGFAGASAERRRRFFGVTNVSTTPVNAHLVRHYNETFKDKITRTWSPSESYDAFYVLAYASYAPGDQPATGPNLSRSIARLLPPGKPVDVGPNAIFDAYNTLHAGQNIDLTGAIGKLDFDVKTGEAPIDFAILCINIDDHGKAYDGIESGLVYNATTKKLEGLMGCP